MKFRADFVTNSSSSSFLVLHIKSEPLARLFQQHEAALSEFFSPDRDFYGKFSIDGDRISIDGGIPDGTISDDVPKTPGDMAWCLASLLTFGSVTGEEQIEEGDFPESLEGILRELFARGAELSEGLESVCWESGTEGYSECDGSVSQHFTYDPENGPSCFMEEVPGMDEEDF